MVQKLFRMDFGNGILLDRPLPFKLHQCYRPLPRFIREFNPASQEIWSGPGMQTSRMWLCKQVLQNFLTETPISLEKYVIFTCCCLLCVWSSYLIAVSNTERRRNDRSSTIGQNDGDIHSYVNKHACNNRH